MCHVDNIDYSSSQTLNNSKHHASEVNERKVNTTCAVEVVSPRAATTQQPFVAQGRVPRMGEVLDGVTYEPVTREFLDQIIALHTELFPVVYGNSFYESLLTDRMVTVLALQHSENEESKVLGISTARTSEDQDWFSCRTTKTGYLSTIGVTNEARRRSIGSHLLNLTLQELGDCGCHYVKLHVMTLNTGAIGFYRRHGFHTAELLDSYYYINGQFYDAYLMQFTLMPPRPTYLESFWSLILRYTTKKAEYL